MTKQVTIEQFYQQIQEEVQLSKENDFSDWTNEDYLTSIMLDYLDDAGEVENAIICPFRDRGVQLNAYSFSDDYSSLILFVTLYKDTSEVSNVSKVDVELAIRRELTLYRKAKEELYKSFEKDNSTYEFAKTIHDKHHLIEKVEVCCLTNGLVKSMPLKNISLDGKSISFNIWDIERLYRCISSGKMREIIEINFEEEFGTLISCLESTASDRYSAYLTIINGEILAKLYSKYRDRLLERNVRSFLQVRGGVNKGIKATLINEPEMFLAYNNGISVTAESVEIVYDESGHPFIKKIRDMQIVNGGQTTASIFTASQDKKNPVDLKKVNVQAKISVITSPEMMDEIVPKISEYANTQNKIQTADFSANDPFHRRIEELSRSIWTPSINGEKPKNWFYERARGQYSDALAMEGTTKRRKEYKDSHPYFTKTDLAKYENSWAQRPFEVSEGAQKNFKKFTVRVSENSKKLPDERYYRDLIAKAILFKKIEKVVSNQNFGGYRANIVTYTMAFLSFKTAQSINLDLIWRTQDIPEQLEIIIAEVSHLVRDVLINAPGGANISEWCKKERCWEAVKGIKYQLPLTVKEIILSNGITYNSDSATITPQSDESPNDVQAEEISKCEQIPGKTWYALAKWAKETNNFDGKARGFLFHIGSRVSRRQGVTFKQASWANKLYREAQTKGFEIDSSK